MNQTSCNFLAVLLPFAVIWLAPINLTIALGQKTADARQPATVTIHLPADAELEVMGQKMTGTGETRSIQTPPLETGKLYVYNIKASWVVDEQPIIVERRIQFRAGQSVDVILEATPPSKDVLAVLELVNKERAKVRAAPLVLDPRLCEVAQAHSENMARQGILSHDLDGKAYWQRIEAAGYTAGESGENCAEGAATPEAVIGMWMHSTGHRENMLNPNYKELGVGVAASPSGVRYWTQVFGTPLGK